MNGHGFIHFWRMFTDSGFITVCSASSPLPGGAPVRFLGRDVTDQGLSDELSQRNINTKAECQSNGQNIRVRFTFGFDTSGNTIAVDVRRF
jgi:hypothetical protein